MWRFLLLTLPVIAVAAKPVAAPPKHKAARRPVHLHIVIRTYEKQVVQLGASVFSILAAAEGLNWLELSIAVLSTGSSEKGAALVTQTVSLIQQSVPQWPNAPRAQIELVPWSPDASLHWGYTASDVELARVLSNDTLPDYVLFCNGDTLYANEIFHEARFEMWGATDVIGMNWMPTVRHMGESLRHIGEQSPQKFCRFQHGGVDLNGLLFRTEVLRRTGAAFHKMHTPCAALLPGGRGMPNGCVAIDTRPYWVADWGLVYQVLSQNATKECLAGTRSLYLQN
jgi:hypothetical protein